MLATGKYAGVCGDELIIFRGLSQFNLLYSNLEFKEGQY